MFSVKSFHKLPPTAKEVARNREVLSALSGFNPFERDRGGALKHPEFADFLKVINSLRVVDNNARQMNRQTNDLQKDVIKNAKHDTFLELVFNAERPSAQLYADVLQDKLAVNLANLILEPEISATKALSVEEIARIKDAFYKMLSLA